MSPYLAAFLVVLLLVVVMVRIWVVLERSGSWEKSRLAEALSKGGPLIWLGILCAVIILVVAAAIQIASVTRQ